MADLSPLAGLLDRAEQILNLVGELADGIRANEHLPNDKTRRRVASAWKALLPAIVEAGESLPSDPNPVADWIRKIGRVSKWFDGAVRQHGLADVLFRFNCDGFIRVDEEGQALFKEMAAKRDRFAFADAPAFTLLDRFPATPAGHVAFLGFVRDEVHHAALAKRGQLERGYSNATIESMVRGIKWAEARARLEAFSGGSTVGLKPVSDALGNELTAGRLEYIDGVLCEAIAWLQRLWARNRELASQIAIVATAGDLWKAYAEGKKPYFQTSGISFRPGGNTPTISCTDDASEAKRTALDRAQALVTVEGGDKAAAMERLIARLQLQAGMDQASVINMPLADFVAAAMGRSNAEIPTGAIKAGEDDFIEQLLAGPDDAELSTRKLAMLEAHLAQPVSMATIQREKHATGESETNAKRNKLILIRDFNRNLRAATPDANEVKPVADAGQNEPAEATAPTKAKRSTERGEGRAKLIAVLTKHHKYADGGCLNLEPIGNNELARLAGVDQATASAFFKKQFKGHGKYKAACADAAGLAGALKLLNGEFSPHHLYGSKPTDEDERDKE